jgi:hypothetical protein
MFFRILSHIRVVSWTQGYGTYHVRQASSALSDMIQLQPHFIARGLLITLVLEAVRIASVLYTYTGIPRYSALHLTLFRYSALA